MPKKAPGTPVKKARMNYFGNDRPWQSAVASKVGLKDDCDFKKVPGRACPLPSRSALKQLNNHERQNTTDTEEEEEYSPSMRRDHKYLGLGLGQPGAPLARNRWLMRRSSSGPFRVGAKRHLLAAPKPRIPLRMSPSGDEPNKISSRSTSGSSNSSVTTLNSPTDHRRSSLVESAGGARHLPPRREMVARRLSDTFAEDEQPGRFERDFEEIEEIGSGEFGKVIKAQSKHDAMEVYAIKKSKQFEGAKHRLRLREEVSILKHLSQAAQSQYDEGRHPNVLAYIDGWEENEALYICTELCESGNLARFCGSTDASSSPGRSAGVEDSGLEIHSRFWGDPPRLEAFECICDQGRPVQDRRLRNGVLWPRPAFFDTASGASASAPGGAQLGGGGGGGGFEREGDKLYLAPEVLQGRYGKAADMFSFGMTSWKPHRTLSSLTSECCFPVYRPRPSRGEGWQRLRREDFSQVDLEEDSPELADLIRNMMRTEPAMRLTIEQVCAHPVVRRACEAMERMHDALKSQGKSTWGASPLASVPAGFLEDILDRGEGAMDTSL
ncbi:hypothetical protein BJ912DRAFT_1063843 [Pholiota molesta]|nr:hypothetical protein BJ912DRAFT_1063843 [Pholiota molesta]